MKTHQPKFNFRTLKEHVPISYILFAYGLDKNLKQRGAKLFGACPLHGGDNPTAFRVNLERGLWHCFTVCGGGDIVDLVRRIECCDYAQAAQYLHRLACSLKAKRQMLSMNLSTSEPSYTTCVHPPRQTSFIPFRRQIPLNPKNSFLQQQKGITVRTALRYEAGWSNRSAFLQGMIAVHLHNLKGAPLGYAGRRLSSDDIRHCGKWRFPPHFPKAELLFNAHRVAAKRDQGVVLVECPWAGPDNP